MKKITTVMDLENFMAIIDNINFSIVSFSFRSILISSFSLDLCQSEWRFVWIYYHEMNVARSCLNSQSKKRLVWRSRDQRACDRNARGLSIAVLFRGWLYVDQHRSNRGWNVLLWIEWLRPCFTSLRSRKSERHYLHISTGENFRFNWRINFSVNLIP